MKAKKTDKPTIHDLRDLVAAKTAVPDVAGEFAGLAPVSENEGPRIVAPGVGVQAPGQTTHE